MLTPSTIIKLTDSGFKGDIILNGQPGFENATLPWSFNYAKNPKLALQPASANDVSLAIKWLNEIPLNFAVRSGGAASSQSDDVIIDLAKLNKVEYVSSEGVIRLGPGNQWGAVYSALASLPVTALGGRIPFVGVGGFALGGGISYLMNRYGLLSDNIVDAQVVLADGSIVWAKDEPDLMYAIKGAGYTIGAVTELVVKAIPKPTSIFSGFVVYPMDHFEAIKQHTVNFTKTNTNPDISLLFAVVPMNGQPVTLVFPVVYGDEAFTKASLPWIWEQQGIIMDTTRSMTWEELQNLQLAFVSHPAPTTNYQQHSIVVEHLTSEVIQAAVDWQAPLLKDPRFEGLQVLFEPFVSGAFSSHDTKGAWPHSSPNMHIVEIFIEQPNATAGDAEVNAEQLRAGAALVEAASGKGSVLPRYPNYVLQGIPAIEFYGDNLSKLKEVKTKFDPLNRFNSNIAISSDGH